MDLGNRCGGLIWSQITLVSSLNSPSSHDVAVTIHAQTGGWMLRNWLMNTKPVFEGVKLNPILLIQGPHFPVTRLRNSCEIYSLVAFASTREEEAIL